MVANTVVHVDNVWLTSLNRTGNAIDIQGEAASINSVANFITQLKRSGYFDNVEIKTRNRRRHCAHRSRPITFR